MNTVLTLSIIYAVVNIAASWFLNHRCKAGPYIGIVGACVGFAVGFLSEDAKGLMLNTTFYFLIGIQGIRSGYWRGQPWFRHKETTCSSEASASS